MSWVDCRNALELMLKQRRLNPEALQQTPIIVRASSTQPSPVQFSPVQSSGAAHHRR